ncbi:hypothetical protein ENBRE01_2652 [Enteropsectra breve]|nr:hypothetical protein ENBRE01_2652 [Enteropsectra breve]
MAAPEVNNLHTEIFRDLSEETIQQKENNLHTEILRDLSEETVTPEVNKKHEETITPNANKKPTEIVQELGTETIRQEVNKQHLEIDQDLQKEEAISDALNKQSTETVQIPIKETIQAELNRRSNEIVQEPGTEKILTGMPQCEESPAVFVCAKFIKKEAKSIIDDYDTISSDAQKHFIAGIMVYLFMSSTKDLMAAFSDSMSAEPAKILQSLCSEIIKGYENKTVAELEDNYEGTTKSRLGECPLSKMFSQISYDYFEERFMYRVGVNAIFNYTKTDDNVSYNTVRRARVLDIKKCMVEKDGITLLKDCFVEMRLPNPTLTENIQWDKDPIKKSRSFTMF